MRRLRLAASARADYDAVDGETRAMLDAYAAGVNAFIQTQGADPLPIEFQLLEARPEPWEPWESLAVFKVRHVLMGTWQLKAWRARLVRHLGVDRAARSAPARRPIPCSSCRPAWRTDGPAVRHAGGSARGRGRAAGLARMGDREQQLGVAGSPHGVRQAARRRRPAPAARRARTCTTRTTSPVPSWMPSDSPSPACPACPTSATPRIGRMVRHPCPGRLPGSLRRALRPGRRRGATSTSGGWHEAATSRETIRVRGTASR